MKRWVGIATVLILLVPVVAVAAPPVGDVLQAWMDSTDERLSALEGRVSALEQSSSSTTVASTTTVPETTTTVAPTTTVPTTTTTLASTTTAPPSACQGIQVAAGADLESIVEDGQGHTYCLAAGTYTISGVDTTVTLDDGDVLVGAGRDQTFIVGVNGAENLLEGAPQAVWEVRSLDISGAVGDVNCAPNCGRAFKGSGDRLTIVDVRCHDNENQCVGTGNAHLYFIDNECDNNGDEEFVTFKDTRSTSCIKRVRGGPTAYTEVRDSYIHDNAWEGVWFDYYEGYAVVENNVIVNNGKAAVGWEVSGGFTGQSYPTLTLRSNDLSGNGNASWANIGAGIVCNTCANAFIFDNDFGGSGPDDAIAFIESTRAWGSIFGVVVDGNRLHGDPLNCSKGDVTCTNNTP